MRRTHPLTREQIQARKDKAVSFTRDVVGDPDRAAEIEDEGLEAYAQRRKLKLKNPTVPHYSEGKTKAERMKYLEQDARRILAAPEKHTAAELRWARDMLAAPNPGKSEASRQVAIISQAVRVLQASYRLSATRAELARAVGDALVILDPGGGDGVAA